MLALDADSDAAKSGGNLFLPLRCADHKFAVAAAAAVVGRFVRLVILYDTRADWTLAAVSGEGNNIRENRSSSMVVAVVVSHRSKTTVRCCRLNPLFSA